MSMNDYHIRVEYLDDPTMNHAYSIGFNMEDVLTEFLLNKRGIIKTSCDAPRCSITYKHIDRVLTVTCPNDDAYNSLSSFTLLNIPILDKSIIILDNYRR
jgi:hypothetical protein